MNIEQANTTAVERMMSARPMLKAVATARDVIPGMKDNLFLHAGPPIEWARMSGPLRGAIIGAMLFEGIAKSEAEATSIVERGEVEFDSCHHHGAVGPMAGVISASMEDFVVGQAGHWNKSFSNFNGGYWKGFRFCACRGKGVKK